MFCDDTKTKKLMEIDEKERPVAVQIFGSDPKIMGEIAKEVSKEADCPPQYLVQRNSRCLRILPQTSSRWCVCQVSGSRNRR